MPAVLLLSTASACQTLSAVVYHAYMMASASGVLYIGVTNHLERRVAEHQSKRAQGFSNTYSTTKLVYFEPFSDIRNAIACEKQWKRWRRGERSL
jgi:putative endonuclease